MPKFHVPCKYVQTEILLVEADSKEQAMNKAYENFGDLECIEQIDGDVEIYYPDIIEIK